MQRRYLLTVNALVLAALCLVIACAEDTTGPSNDGPGPLASISAGGGHTCGLTATGAAYCWGGNARGEAGDGTKVDRLTPTAVLMPAGVTFTSLAAGDNHTCALTPTGAAYCWGFNLDGALGDGTQIERLAPTAVLMPAGVTFTNLAAGAVHTCALTPEGAAYCWGNNVSGQLGDGTTTERWFPVAVMMPAGLSFTRIDVNLSIAHHSCGLASTGAAYCWGDNALGQLGDGTTTGRLTPVAVEMPAGETFASLAVSGYHVCGQTPTGEAYCWGMNFRGRLGDGTTDHLFRPVAVAMPDGVTFASIAPGWVHTCGLTPSGAAYCWGWNRYGQLGDGTTTDRLVPVKVAQD